MEKTTPAAPNTQAATADPAVVAAALAADQSRRSDIRANFAKFSAQAGVAALGQACEDDASCTVEQANAKLLAHIGKDCAPIAGGRIVTLEDETDKHRTAAAAAVMARAGLAKHDTANQYRGYTMYELARATRESAANRTLAEFAGEDVERVRAEERSERLAGAKP